MRNEIKVLLVIIECYKRWDLLSSKNCIVKLLWWQRTNEIINSLEYIDDIIIVVY